jgi:hypothetical protein
MYRVRARDADNPGHRHLRHSFAHEDTRAVRLVGFTRNPISYLPLALFRGSNPGASSALSHLFVRGATPLASAHCFHEV